MNINQIKYFVSSVENGSFSAAAAEQFITAQGISKAIADLEKELGEPLLIRKNRGVVPASRAR
ncbi:MAG: LysR family transcriptional regulator [Raoultibacter sp.]